jgi:phospholipid transport system transporter-binding protein
MSPPGSGSAHLRRESEDRFTLAGEITFATVPRLSKFGAELLRGGGERYLSLAAVERTDSAGLALLVDWLARARAQGIALHYEAMPDKLRGLAAISEVDALLECGATAVVEALPEPASAEDAAQP